ncbi:MAG: Cys-tRNA(Pro)/Cys-tRNA(Cys) deacylase [Frankiales bacterium]|nr:Cys-tRNA(Pro)/Cys-tRNA(Cys) deacylase [Frankiales bacterium]
MSEQRAVAALEEAGVSYRLVRHGEVSNAQEAAAARGVDVADLAKTIVVRRGNDDYVFVLVPGDAEIAWPHLRQVLGVRRLSLPDAAEAKDATGYVRGTITPFGATRCWPVVVDERFRGRTIALGAGAHGVAAVVPADEMIRALGATVAPISTPV